MVRRIELERQMSSDGGELRPATSLGELSLLFLKLGTIAFGGPAAHIAMMQDEVVRRRKWLSDEEFLDLLSASNLIPGPNSTELAIHIGYVRAGWPGLLIAGSCFIFPAFLIVIALAWAYVRFGGIPEVGSVLYGVKPVIIAIVLQALWSLARSAVRSVPLGVMGAAVVVLSFLGVNELILLFAAGMVVVIIKQFAQFRKKHAALLPIGLLLQTAAVSATPFSLTALFLFFLKVGSVLFGSGYVLLAFLRGDLVERWGWLTNDQLLNAITVGQITPGPVFTTATFIGYILAGAPGAVVATVGIFLPAFIFVGLSGWIVPRLRQSATLSSFLDGINVASLALMIYVTFELGKSALIDGLTVSLAVAAAFLLIRFKLNSAWLVAAGAVIGLAAGLLNG